MDAALAGQEGGAGGPRAAILVSARQIASRERLFLRIADLLALRGYRVAILAAGPEAHLRQVVQPPLSLHDIAPRWTSRAPVRLPHLLRLYLSVFALARHLRATAPELLFATSVPPNLVAVLARRLAPGGTRLVLRQSNIVQIAAGAEADRAGRRWRDLLIPRLYPRADAVIAVAEGVAENLRRLRAVPAHKLHAIPNAIDLARVERLAQEPVPHPWLAEEIPVILAAGRLFAQKDYPTLLRAFAGLRRSRNVRLIVLGEGPERGRLEALARRLGVERAVHLAGFHANPFAFMARARLFVLSSRFEGMPSVLLEALACGCPVVSTDCPSGPAEILEGGRHGSLVPVGDAEALRAAMDRALDETPDPARRKARAAAFGLEPIASRYVRVLLGEDDAGGGRA